MPGVRGTQGCRGPPWPRPVPRAPLWSRPTAGPEQLPLPSWGPVLPEPPSGVPLMGLCQGREPEAPGSPILQGPGKVARPSVGSQRVRHNVTTQQQPARPQGCCALHTGGDRHPRRGQPPLPSTGLWGTGTALCSGPRGRTPHRTVSDMPRESFLHSLDVRP